MNTNNRNDMQTSDGRLLYLINHLIAERGDLRDIDIPESEEGRFRLYRSLVNIRPPKEASEEYLADEDGYLRGLSEDRGVTDIADLTPIEGRMYLWRGDITTLRCAAIVNAANSGMTGCYQPCHSCIDNCIHTFAGIRLRYHCGQLMDAQGHEEPTGMAKVTPAFNLPCSYVIHTVGPIVRGALNGKHRALLRSCYERCLEAAVQRGIESIAFCCISTGVFGFPQKEAAEIAVNTVREFLTHSEISVIFNVFSEKDEAIYRSLLST